MPTAAGEPLYYGRVYGSYLTNLPVGQKARIDFLSQNNCVYPSGSIINVPGEATNNIHIRNDGPCIIQYSVNGGDIEDMIGGILATTISRELKWPDTIIKSVNVLCLPTGANLYASISVEVMK